MTSRKGSGKTISIEFNDAWLEEDNWNIQAFEVDQITRNTAKIELLGLRPCGLKLYFAKIFVSFLSPPE